MNSLKFLAALFLSISLLSTTVHAKCYSKIEAEADQGIRIHSELMVIGLNCQAMGARQGLNLYGDYRQFTNDHAELFSRYEEILINFYKNNGDVSKGKLNALRTKYANAISKIAASQRPDVFCAQSASRIEKAAAMQRSDLRRWASTLYDSHPVSYPLCK